MRINNILTHRVFKNSVALIIMQLFSYISPLLVLPLLARVMTVNDFGMLMMIFSFLTISLVFSDFGFNLSGTYYISKNIKNHNEICKFLCGAFIIKLFICTILILLTLIFSYNSTIIKNNLIYIEMCLIMLFQSFQPSWFFQGLEKMKNITIYTILSKLLYLILVFSFANDGNIEKVLLSYLISHIFATFFSIYFIFKLGYKFSIPSIIKIRYYFSNSIPFFLSRVAVVAYTSANTLVLGNYANLKQAAIYSSSEKIYNAGQGILNPISQAFFPYLAKTKNASNYIKFIIFSSILLSFFCFILSFFVKDVILIFYGSSFQDAESVLKIFLIIIIITYISVNFGYPMYATLGKVKYVNNTVLFGAVLQVIGLIFLYKSDYLTATSLTLLVLIVESIILLCRVTLYYILKNRIKNVI